MLILKGQVEKASEDAEGMLGVSVASSSVVDRDGEIINQDGWDLKNFKKNPQLLWAHNMREVRPPIGKVTKIWFEGTGKSKVMKFKALFDMADEFAKEIYRKIKDGFLSAFSVGFMPLEREGSTYTKVELLEISVVPIPSNPQALVEMRGKGIEPMTWKELAENEEESAEEVEEEVETESEVDENEQPIEEEVSSQEDEVIDGSEDEQEAEKEEVEVEEKPENEYLKAQIREMMKEIKQEREDKDLEVLRDSLRIVYQAVAIALKNLKDMKGGAK